MFISDRVALESEYLRTLRALGSLELTATDLPSGMGFEDALPLLARVVDVYWDQADARVLPVLEPARATLAAPLHLHLERMSLAALASLTLLADFVGLERVRSACVYVLVKSRHLLRPRSEAV